MCSLSSAWNFYQKHILSEKTHRSQVSECGRWKHIHACLGDMNIRDLTPLEELQLKTALRAKKLSPQSISHCLSLLSRVINRVKRVGIYSGPVPIFEMPRFDNRRIRFLSKKEAQALLTHLRIVDSQWADISHFALMTGLRAGEIFRLTPRNFDSHNKLLNFYDFKTNTSRTIPLNRIACKLLERNGPPKGSTDFFFKNYKGEPWKEVSNTFRKAVDYCEFNKNINSGLERVVFHTLRHTFASWLVQEGIQLQIISILLGHKNIKTTMRYAHLSPDQGRNAVAILTKIKL